MSKFRVPEGPSVNSNPPCMAPHCYFHSDILETIKLTFKYYQERGMRVRLLSPAALFAARLLTFRAAALFFLIQGRFELNEGPSGTRNFDIKIDEF